MSNESNELYHYGVKGMKWGVRRSQEQLGHKPKVQSRTDTPSQSKKKPIFSED